MPNIWQAVDANFPTLQQDDPLEEQYKKLHSYMFVLTEQLKYSLANLDSSNWNGNALEKERSETTEKVEKDVTGVAAQIRKIANELTEALDRLNSLDIRTGTAEENVNDLTNFKGTLEQFITPVPEAKQMTIGKSGQTINLVGTIYVNGRQI